MLDLYVGGIFGKFGRTPQEEFDFVSFLFYFI